MGDLFFLQAVYVMVGLSITAVAVPLVMRRIKPNPFYGFRTPKAFSSDATWYEINAYSGKRLCIAGILIAAAGLLAPFAVGDDILLYVVVVTLVLSASLGVGLIQSFVYLGTLTK